MIKGKRKTFEYFFSKRVIFCVMLLLFFTFLFPALVPVQAVDVGSEYAEKTGLPGTDPRVIAVRIIQIALGFLGIIAVGLIMYGGFLWMTSNGNEEQIAKAKKTLRNAVIGLLIILSSFSIVTFVLSRMLDATGAGSGGSSGPSVGGSGGIGVLGNCSVESIYPTDGQNDVPRNTSIIITFREEVDSATVCDDGGDGRCDGDPIRDDGRIKLYRSGDDPEATYIKDVNVYDTADRRTFVFVPGVYLGSPSEFIWYTMLISNNEEGAGEVTKSDGTPVFDDCRNNYVEWKFEVSNVLDLTPPQLREGRSFPPPDNIRDSVSITSNAARAQGSIAVDANPDVYTSSILESSNTIVGPDIQDIAVYENNDQGGDMTVTVLDGGVSAQLSRGGTLLGASEFNGQTVEFDNIFSLTVDGEVSAGNQWEISISPKVQADTLTIGRDVYTFVPSASTDNQITLGADVNATAANIASAIDGHPSINASASGNVVDVEARVAGVDGDDIIIETSDGSKLDISGMQGGSDRVQTATVNDKKDQPMNSVIQMNFNEAVMPTTVSGPASDINDHIRVVNAESTARDGDGCSIDADCASYNCSAGTCEGDHLPGTFRLSNQYKTVEFISDDQCGVNGCGEPIYCLPKNSHLRVELIPASLASCSGDPDCSSKNPYDSCIDNVCKENLEGNYPDSRTRNYPGVDVEAMDGIMDAALNSFDGDRNGYAEGPVEWFSDNTPQYSSDQQCQDDIKDIIEAVTETRIDQDAILADVTGTFDSGVPCESDPGSAACLAAQRFAMQAIGFNDAKLDRDGNIFILNENEDQPGLGACVRDTISSSLCGNDIEIPTYFCDEGDNFRWSFYISEEMEIEPPVIENISPNSNGASLSDPAEAVFDKMLMSSTLKTGYTIIKNEQGGEIMHKNVNLWSLGGLAPGYWTTNDGLDTDLNGQVDKTKLMIKHSMLAESVTYRGQIGSGVKDIYQNCFKPSSGPGCSVSDFQPSCCDGSEVDVLGPTGDCP